MLGAGFDPGVVNAYAALAAKKYFDTIDTIDILDVNAGSHGRYFATNFDPEINFREFVKVWTWIDREWQEFPTHAVKRTFDVPGRRRAADLPQRPRRAALAVEAHRRQQHPLLDGLRRPLHQRVHRAAHARPAVARTGRSSPAVARSIPLQVVKAVLPDPQSLAAGYTGKTCIGDVVKGTKDGKPREMFIYQVSRSRRGLRRGGVAGHQLHRGRAAGRRRRADRPRHVGRGDDGQRRGARPEPFIAMLDRTGLPTEYLEIEPGSAASFQGEVRPRSTTRSPGRPPPSRCRRPTR